MQRSPKHEADADGGLAAPRQRIVPLQSPHPLSRCPMRLELRESALDQPRRAGATIPYHAVQIPPRLGGVLLKELTRLLPLSDAVRARCRPQRAPPFAERVT